MRPIGRLGLTAQPRPPTLGFAVRSALLALPLVALGFVATDASGARCGDLNHTTANIQTHGVSCRTARKVARAWHGRASYRAYGFRCRYRATTATRPGKISCRNGSATVIFYTGS